jgi:hypothetical protein
MKPARMRPLALAFVLGCAACHADGLVVGPGDGGPDGVDFAMPVGSSPMDMPIDPPALPPAGDRCGGAAHAAVTPCGDADHCNLTTDEVLPVMVGTNDGPQIVLEGGKPLVFVPLGQGEPTGQLLRRGAGGWSATPTAVGVTGALARSHDAIGRVDYDGAFGTTYYDETGSGWTASAPAGEYVAFGGSLAIDDAHCAYLALMMSARDQLRLARHADGWSYAQPFGADQVEHSRIALAPDGSPQIVGWRVQNAGWVLSWASKDGTEPIQPSTGNVLGWQQLRFDVASDATPHLLLQDADLRHVTRGAAGWTQTVLGTSSGGSACAGSPTMAGQTCDDPVQLVEGVAVLTDGSGGVRLLWTRVDQIRHMVASCTGSPPAGPSGPRPGEPNETPDLAFPPPWSCTWQASGQTSKASLLVSTPELAGSATPIALGHGLARASAALADDGTIHVVGDDGGAVRYLVVGR